MQHCRPRTPRPSTARRQAASTSACESFATRRSVSSGVGKPHSALSAKRDRVVEPAVGEDGVAVAQLLARPVELVGAESLLGRAPAGVLDGAREADSARLRAPLAATTAQAQSGPHSRWAPTS